jgi:hypothetical protein
MRASCKEGYPLSVENKGTRIKLNRADWLPYTDKTKKEPTFQVHTLIIPCREKILTSSNEI